MGSGRLDGPAHIQFSQLERVLAIIIPCADGSDDGNTAIAGRACDLDGPPDQLLPQANVLCFSLTRAADCQGWSVHVYLSDHSMTFEFGHDWCDVDVRQG